MPAFRPETLASPIEPCPTSSRSPRPPSPKPTAFCASRPPGFPVIPAARPSPQAPPGRLLRLGTHRGGIDERWFASTTICANENRAHDEGLSYVVAGKEKFTLADAVADLGAEMIGDHIWNTYKKWPVYSKFFDNMGPIPITCTRMPSRPSSSARKANPNPTTSRRSSTPPATTSPIPSWASSPARPSSRSSTASTAGTKATTASSTSRKPTA